MGNHHISNIQLYYSPTIGKLWGLILHSGVNEIARIDCFNFEFSYIKIDLTPDEILIGVSFESNDDNGLMYHFQFITARI